MVLPCQVRHLNGWLRNRIHQINSNPKCDTWSRQEKGNWKWEIRQTEIRREYNRMPWAQPSPGFNCCASLLPFLLPGNRYCSAIGWHLSWLHLQAMNCQWGTIRQVIQPMVGSVWSTGGEWGKRHIQAFSQRLSSSPSLGPVGEIEGLGNRLGYGLQDSRALIRAIHSAWQQCWTSVPSPSLQPNSSSRQPGCSRWDLVFPLSHLGGLRSLRASWVSHLAPSVMTAGQGLGTWPWGSCQLRSASS